MLTPMLICAGKKMDLMELNETRVLKHLTAVSAARSEAILVTLLNQFLLFLSHLSFVFLRE